MLIFVTQNFSIACTKFTNKQNDRNLPDVCVLVEVNQLEVEIN